MAAQATLKTVWGIAKSPELKLTDEELHLVVEAHTGKDSLKALNKRELTTVVRALSRMKDSSRRSEHGESRNTGNPATENQRKKVYCLTRELGWDKPARVNGLCNRMFGINRVEWLNYQQCSKLIEALKSMAGRAKETADEKLQGSDNSQQ